MIVAAYGTNGIYGMHGTYGMYGTYAGTYGKRMVHRVRIGMVGYVRMVHMYGA